MKPKFYHRSRYRILGQIGQGQFGRVYFAVHRQTGNFVALKDLHRQSSPTNQFLREFAYLISLNHPNIVSCKAIEHHPQGRYLVMDYCEGGTLRNLMDSEGQLSLKVRLNLIADVLLGLEHAHQNKIVHCDIKPENILLSLADRGWTARITDFGIARQLTQERGNSHPVSGYTGSPAYMAPERFYGKYSPACDLYSVGILLYELIVGERPFSGLPGELMSAHLNQRLRIPDTVPDNLCPIIKTALEKLPQRRFSGAREMLDAVLLVADKLQTSSSNQEFFLPPILGEISQGEVCVQASFPTAIAHLAVCGEQIYWGMEEQLCRRTYADASLTGEPIQQWQIPLSGTIKELYMRPQGCLVLVRSPTLPIPQYTLYCIAPTLTSIQASSYPISLPFPAHQVVSTVDLQGHWLALRGSDHKKATTHFQLFKLPRLSPIKPPILSPPFSQFFSLDSRHGLALFPYQTQGKDRTFFYLFNRRGSFIKRFSFPLILSNLTQNLFSPYELFGIELGKSAIGILINFKPLKITRIPLNITPKFIIAQSWGYGLANETGQIIILDREGFQIGRWELSVTITAMAGFGKSGLLIASLSQDKAMLSTLDLASII